MKKYIKPIVLFAVSAFLLTGCNQGGSSSTGHKPTTSESSSSTTSESSTSSTSTSTSTGSTTGPTSYYERATGSGKTLLDNLKTIINDGFKNLSYSGLLTAYKTTDVKESDPTEINDYYSNSTHWKINGSQSCGGYTKEGDCYNREHSIPKSWWGGSPDKSSQGSDVFIVVPSDGYVNNRRGNMLMGEVSKPTYSSNNGYSKIGPNTFPGNSSTCFEPNDEWKGDFARIHMYALVKWNASTWTSGDGGKIFSGSYTSAHIGFTDYAFNLFKKWNQQDPVSEYERKKNDAAYALQKNRNPFVDDPTFANRIWGM